MKSITSRWKFIWVYRKIVVSLSFDMLYKFSLTSGFHLLKTHYRFLSYEELPEMSL